MAFASQNTLNTTDAAVFIPELWSDEVVAAYKANLVLANLVTRMNHVGKKGDTVHIPTPDRASASAKAADAGVTLINSDAETEVTISINKHYEYSRLIEDILEKQAVSSMRGFYTDDAGHALATQVDTDLWTTTYNLQGGDGAAAYHGDQAVIGSDGSTLFSSSQAGVAIADAGLRKAIQTLDDANIPLDNRVLVVPPVEKMNLTGVARFTEQAFAGEAGSSNTIRSGLIGDLYGIPVFVSTNAPTNNSSRACFLGHKSAIALVEQMGIRSQTQYKQEYLGDLFTADTIYGVGELRNDAGILIAVPT